MADTNPLIQQAYMAFNERNIDAALALMTPDVSWPKASEGGRVIGKEEIRAYWTRQWQEFDPRVEPLEITGTDTGKLRVTVHQVVKTRDGNVLADTKVVHLFTLREGLIAAMHLGVEGTPTGIEDSDAVSAAFAHRA